MATRSSKPPSGSRFSIGPPGSPIDLVLTGVGLPEGGGPEIVSRLSALRPGIRILSMAGSANDAPDAGVAHLKKPFVPADLVRSVRRLLDS